MSYLNEKEVVILIYEGEISVIGAPELVQGEAE